MSRGLRTTTDMLRTMLVMAAAVGLLVLLVPRPTSVPRPVVDLASAADQAGAALGFTPATPVPQGWTVTSARVRRDTDDLPSWTINYLTEDESYVGLVQADGWTQRWQSSLTHGGEPDGDVDVAGQTWAVFVKPEREITSLLLRQGQTTTLVLAKGGGLADARVLAQALAAGPDAGATSSPSSAP